MFFGQVIPTPDRNRCVVEGRLAANPGQIAAGVAPLIFSIGGIVCSVTAAAATPLLPAVTAICVALFVAGSWNARARARVDGEFMLSELHRVLNGDGGGTEYHKGGPFPAPPGSE
jgi:hypothetical protein